MRVVVADDHPLVADVLGHYLKRIDPDIDVLKAKSLSEALEYADKPPGTDLMLLDLHMPGMDGLEGLTRIRDRLPDMPVVIVSGFTNRGRIYEAFDRGAAGFIPKQLSPTAITKALELILAGEKFVPSNIVGSGVGAEKTDRNGQQMWEPDSPLNDLTAREGQVLYLLLEGRSNKEIAQKIGVEEVTAAFHLRGVFRKLGVSNRTQAAARALKLGWDRTGEP